MLIATLHSGGPRSTIPLIHHPCTKREVCEPFSFSPSVRNSGIDGIVGRAKNLA